MKGAAAMVELGSGRWMLLCLRTEKERAAWVIKMQRNKTEREQNNEGAQRRDLALED